MGRFTSVCKNESLLLVLSYGLIKFTSKVNITLTKSCLCRTLTQVRMVNRQVNT